MKKSLHSPGRTYPCRKQRQGRASEIARQPMLLVRWEWERRQSSERKRNVGKTFPLHSLLQVASRRMDTASTDAAAWNRIAWALIIANWMQISICLQIGVVGKNAMQSLMAELRIQSMNAGASRMGGRGGIWIWELALCSTSCVHDYERYLMVDFT